MSGKNRRTTSPSDSSGGGLSAVEALRLRRRRSTTRALVISGAATILILIVVALALPRNTGPIARPTTPPTPAAGDTTTMPVSIGDHFIRVGTDDAVVTVDLYEDFSCPHCQDYEALIGDTLVELARTGEVAVQYHPVRIVTPYGNRAGSAAACVAEGAPTLWNEVHASLFAIHSESTDGWSTGMLRDHVAELGVEDPGVLDCVEEGRYQGWIDENTAAARDAGITATPTLLIDGVEAGLLDPAGIRDAVAGALGS